MTGAPRLRADPAVLARFPAYSAVIVYARGLGNGESDADSIRGLREAEAFVRAQLAEPVSAHPHLAAWRNAFSAFGAKPSKYLCSAEALVKRVLKGDEIPAINRVVDAYNAVSLRHVVPAGGEDLDRLESDLTLSFAQGGEPFDVIGEAKGGDDPVYAGEVVWKDSVGVTCRRWNWRQCRRTRIVPETRNAYFVIDRLDPYPRSELHHAAVELVERLRRISPECGLELETLRPSR